MQTNDVGTVDRTITVGAGDPATRAKIESWVKEFAENEFPAINKAIVKCLEDYKAQYNSGQ